MGICFSGTARGIAGVIALIAWVGLAVQFDVSSVNAGSAWAASWSLLRYFTILTNIVLAVVFTGVALGKPRFGAPSLLGGVVLAILLVGVVYILLLQGSVELSGGGAKLANFLMHYVTPFVAPLFWLGYTPKGALSRRDPWIWALFPLVYFVYALVRGRIEGRYAYPFMDVARIGWTHTGINAAMIALGFVLAGHAMLWLDSRLARSAVWSRPEGATNS